MDVQPPQGPTETLPGELPPPSFLCIRGVGRSQEVLSVYFYTNLSRTLTRPTAGQVEKPVESSDGF